MTFEEFILEEPLSGWCNPRLIDFMQCSNISSRSAVMTFFYRGF